MLIDFEGGTTFALPAPYTLQAQFDTVEQFFGESDSGAVPIAFIATRGNAIYVVFRGTKTIAEWVSDATFSQVDYTYVANAGKTETGFSGIYASIRGAMIQKVASLASGGTTYTTLYVTGHSLGAALAVLAAPDFAAQTPFKQPVVYTFAGPRAGDPLFASVYDLNIGTTWRVVNTNDEVPKLPNVVSTIIGPPPENRPEFFFYEHVNSEYPITFGQPIRSISDVLFNHSSCNYYATLCGKTSNPTECKAQGQGLDACSF
jgi:triacylglycerol lipase